MLYGLLNVYSIKYWACVVTNLYGSHMLKKELASGMPAFIPSVTLTSNDA